MGLEALRDQIDEVDRQLVALLGQRAELSILVAREKRKQNVDIVAPDRERAVLENVTSQNQSPLPNERLQAIFRLIIACSTEMQSRTERDDTR